VRDGEALETRTIPVGPQERARRLPFLVDITLEEPRGGSIVVRITCSVVIDRWIRGGEPLMNVFLQMIT